MELKSTIAKFKNSVDSSYCGLVKLAHYFLVSFYALHGYIVKYKFVICGG